MEDINRVQSSISGMDISGKIVVVKKDYFKPEYREGDRRFLAEGGFGTKPYLMGQAVMGKFLVDGEEARINRSDIEGLSCTNPKEAA